MLCTFMFNCNVYFNAFILTFDKWIQSFHRSKTIGLVRHYFDSVTHFKYTDACQ